MNNNELLEQALQGIADEYNVNYKTLSSIVNDNINRALALLQEGDI